MRTIWGYLKNRSVLATCAVWTVPIMALLLLSLTATVGYPAQAPPMAPSPEEPSPPLFDGGQSFDTYSDTCCVGGPNDGQICNTPEDCPATCFNGVSRGQTCYSNEDCKGYCYDGFKPGYTCRYNYSSDCPGICVSGIHINEPCYGPLCPGTCLGGSNKDGACIKSDECPGSMCGNIGLCNGYNSCVETGQCPSHYECKEGVCHTTTTTSSTTTTVSTTTSTDGGDVITLSSFEAIPENKKVTLSWATETEIDNVGFNIYRAEYENGEYIKINTALIPAKGLSTQGAAYEFIDTEVQNRKTYYYKLEDIDLSGTSTMHGPESATPRLIHGILGK